MHAARLARFGSYELPDLVVVCLGCDTELRLPRKRGKRVVRCDACKIQHRSERRKQQRRLPAEMRLVPLTCLDCGEPFIRKRLGAITPSRCQSCAKERDYEMVRLWKVNNPSRYAELGRQNVRRRRARIRSLPMEAFEDREIYEAHGWTCWICEGAIDSSAKHPEDGAPTIDHLLPISKQGPHTRANVRPAHWVCNRKRNNKMDGPYARALILYLSDYRKTGNAPLAPPVGVSTHALNTGGIFSHG